jgi:hypothetical protein
LITQPVGVSHGVTDDADKARVMGVLRDAGVSFARGREWSPAEVFEWLRDPELLTGSFRSISWRRPGVFDLREDA